jgi:hypothetical protein
MSMRIGENTLGAAGVSEFSACVATANQWSGIFDDRGSRMADEGVLNPDQDLPGGIIHSGDAWQFARARKAG